MNYISQNIKTLRMHFNLTQDDLAIKIDTKRHNIAQWEIGRAHPNVLFLQKLCEVFTIPISDMISKEIDENYFIKAEEVTTIYYNNESKSARELIKFLQDQLKEKDKIINKLLDQLKKHESEHGTTLVRGYSNNMGQT